MEILICNASEFAPLISKYCFCQISNFRKIAQVGHTIQ